MKRRTEGRWLWLARPGHAHAVAPARPAGSFFAPALPLPSGSRAVPVVRPSARVAPVSPFPPAPTFCEVHVGPFIPDCPDCISGLLVCAAHLLPCGAESLTTCNFCLKVLCSAHLYCPCADAVARRLDVESRLAAAATSRPSSAGVDAALSAVLPVPSAATDSEFARCLSPGPMYEGPEPDPSIMVSPFVELPDWPISRSWAEFAFLPIIFHHQPDSPLRVHSSPDSPF